MSRAQRLLDLLQLLRRHRRAVTGAVLADELGVSLRTLYRDIDALKAQGAPIDGAAGLGFVLHPGFTLPPLMFSDEEVEALVLGSRWVSERADGPLGAAARNVLAKIGAVLPEALKTRMDTSGLLIGPGAPIGDGAAMATVRAAMGAERRVLMSYADEDGAASERVIWPVALAFYDQVRVLVAWCELREGFRHFRVDRIATLEMTAERFPRRRAVLLKEWHASQGVPEQ